MKKLGLILFTTMFAALSIKAADIEITTGDDKVTISPMGRFYLDGAVFSKDKTNLGNGVYMSDARVGLKAKYQQFDMKVDVGYAGGKVSAKDIFVQYSFVKNSYIRAGHFAEPFGLDHMESSSNIKFITANATSYAFSPGRKLGFEYIGWNRNMWVGAGVFGDGDAVNNSKAGDDGYSIAGRYVFNPLQKEGRILHVGLAGTVRKADANGYNEDGYHNPRFVNYSSRLNTNVDKTKVLNATISNANYQSKYAVELIAAYGPVHLQAEYFNAHVTRKDGLQSYKASGAYAQVGFLAIGKNYSYASAWARMAAPKPKSLEFVVRYNYTDLNDNKAQIYGGRMSDIALAANYYLNKYIVLKMDYTHASFGKKGVAMLDENVDVVQARIQVVF